MTAGHICKTCGNWRPIERFGTYLSRGKRYRCLICKDCANARGREYMAKQRALPGWRDKRRAYERERYQKNHDQRRAQCNAWYTANSAKVRLRQRQRRLQRVMRRTR